VKVVSLLDVVAILVPLVVAFGLEGSLAGQPMPEMIEVAFPV
jgi:hypothetical protein